MRKRNIIFIVCILLLFFIISLPILAPILHNDNSPRSAIRNYIQNAGHPYQSFFAVIQDKNIKDKQYGTLYDVLWNDWDNVTGSTGHLCYAKKIEEGSYKISCGTGP
jgi:hypothetical protein